MPLFLGIHWWPILVFPLGTAAVLFIVWLWRGRDDRATVPVKSSWQPPLELSPAQVATLIDDSCDLRDIVATLVDLAVRGYIHIEEVPPGDLVLTRGDLRFVRCSPAPPLERLRKHERLFLSALFDPQPPDIERGRRPANSALSDEPWNETALSLLENKFYRHIAGIEQEIYRSLLAEGFSFSDPKSVRAFYSAVGLQLLWAGFFVLRADLNRDDMGLPSALISFPLGVMLSGLVWWGSARFMPAKTALGTLKTDQIHRFVAWVKSVEISVLAPMIRKDTALFERFLPYAIVLGVGPLWARKCDECGQWAPLWFCYHSREAQNAPGMVVRLVEHLSGIERVLASAPPVNRE